ncbi:MAG: hypothetical protein K0R63_912 [Rickettsiales bacterium]|nr:hypothetical protein [Rickettsiales bacterium]
MKKLFVLLLVLGFAAGGFIYIAPMFGDAEGYKARFIEEIRNTTGLEPEVQGDVTTSMFFTPKIIIHDIILHAPDDRFTQDLIVAPTVEIKASLIPFLMGKVAISSVTLHNPSINIEVLEDGTKNWAALKKADGSGIGGSFGGTEVDLAHAIITYDDMRSGKVRRFEHVTGHFSASSLTGPFAFKGQFNLGSRTYFLKSRLEQEGEGAYKADGTIGTKAFELAFKGNVSGIVEGKLPVMDIRFNAQGNDIASVLSDYSSEPTDASAEEGKFTFQGGLKSDGKTLVLDKVALQSEVANAVITGNFVFDHKLMGDADINVDFLDLDQLMRRGVTQTVTLFDVPFFDSSISFKLAIKEMRYNLDYARNIHADGQILGGALEIEQLTATIPGESTISLSGIFSQQRQQPDGDVTISTGDEPTQQWAYHPSSTAQRFPIPEFNGKITVQGKQARELLRWFDINTTTLPEGTLGTFSADGKMRIAPQRVEFYDAVLRVDRSYVQGDMDIRYGFGRRTVAYAALDVDYLNLDQYIKPSDKEEKKDDEDPHQWLRKLRTLPFDITLDISSNLLVFEGNRIRDLEFIGTATDDTIALERISIHSDLADFDGNIILDVTENEPHINAAFNARYLNTDFFKFEHEAGAATEAAEKPADATLVVAKEGEPPAPPALWPTEKMDLSWLGQYEGLFTVKIDALKHGDILINDLSLSGDITDTVLQIKEGKGKVFDGEFTLAGPLRTAGFPVFGITFSANNLHITPKIVANSPLFKHLSGYMSVSGSIGTSGNSMNDWINQLNGSMAFAARGVKIENFDLHTLIQKFLSVPSSEANNFITQTLSQGTTDVHSMDGTIMIKQGVLEIPQLIITTSMSSGSFGGAVDLRQKVVNTVGQFDFLIEDRATNLRPKLTVGVKISGRFDGLQRQTDYRSIMRYISERDATLNKKK